MATFDFNTLMQTAKSASFDPLPIGDYDAECISADAVTSTTGKPMIKCKFEVISGPHAKRKFFNQYVLSVENEVALAMFFRQMKAFGLDENFFAAVGQQGLAPVAQTMLGRRARFTLGIRKWNEEDRNEVTSTKPLAGGVAAGPGGLPGTGAPSLPGLPTSGGLPTSAPAAPAAVAQPTQPTAPTPPTVVQPAAAAPVAPVTAPPVQAAPVAPVQNGTVPPPVPPAPAAVAQPVQPIAPPQPVQQPVAPTQPEPQPVPPVEQVAVAAAPAVSPPPPMPF